MSELIEEKTYALFANPVNRRIIHALENAGAKVLQFPPIEVEKIILDEAVTENLKNLNSFDWLIFSDVLAVEFFLENLAENEIDSFEMDLLRVCAFGETISDALRFASLHADVISSIIETDNVYAAMIEYIGESELDGLKFLFPQQRQEENDLREKLQSKGATVIKLPVYQIADKNKTEIIRLKTLLKGGAIDEFVFASPTDLIALRHYFKNEKLNDLFAEITTSTADRVLLQTIAEYGFSKAGLFQTVKLDKVIE